MRRAKRVVTIAVLLVVWAGVFLALLGCQSGEGAQAPVEEPPVSSSIYAPTSVQPSQVESIVAALKAVDDRLAVIEDDEPSEIVVVDELEPETAAPFTVGGLLGGIVNMASNAGLISTGWAGIAIGAIGLLLRSRSRNRK